ncbi:hypothetical protein B296_00003074, partial [Ensete ventricosum]
SPSSDRFRERFLLRFDRIVKGGRIISLFRKEKIERDTKERDEKAIMMGEDKSSPSSVATGSRERDRELLIPVGEDPAGDGDSKTSAAAAAASASRHHSGREAFHKVVRSWASKKFMTGCVILFPIAITFYITWWFIRFVDGFFSPIYAQLGIGIFGMPFFVMIFFYHLNLQNYTGEEELFCVYVPTNHLYIGDIFMINSGDVIRPNLSVREGIG